MVKEAIQIPGSKKADKGLGYPTFPVFCVLWLVVFILYLPAAEAGRVGDFAGWAHFMSSVGFVDYLNRSNSGIAGMYQLTQLLTWLYFQAFGANAWMWHLLFISIQAINGLLVFIIFRRLFSDSSIKDGQLIAISGALLFCLCPHISEVVVWESAFHYLLGLLLILLVILCAQNYLNTQKIKYAWLGALLFFLATYSLEVFYLTPLFVITLIVYYRNVLGYGKTIFGKALLFFMLPQALLFALYFVALRLVYHSGMAHIYASNITVSAGNSAKLLKYLFHVIFLGRFFPGKLKDQVYQFAVSAAGLAVVYSILAIVFLGILIRFRKMNNPGKALVLVFIWVLLSIGFVLPIWFPESGLVVYDRYTYVLDAFVYVFLSLFINRILGKKVFLATVLAYAAINIFFTLKVNTYWQKSAHIVNKLLYTFPDDSSGTVLLLDLPDCLDGVPMIVSRDDGQFKMMYNAIMPHQINNTVYDVESYYLQSPADGAHVNVINDSTVRVTLNQWGTWWLYYGFGSRSYENSDYKVNMIDEGHLYELTLKRAASQYLLLYDVGDEWKTVDMGKKNVDQL